MRDLSPAALDRVCAQAARHVEENRPARAVALLQPAADLGASYPKLLCLLATAYAALPDFARAEAMVARLLGCWPGRAELHAFAGELYYTLRRVPRSLQSFGAGAAAGALPTPARLRYAEVAERAGELDLCLAVLDGVRSEDPAADEARILRAAVLRRRGNVTEAEALLRGVLAKPGASRAARRRAGHALAELLDGVAAYAEAGAVLLATKAAMETDYAVEIADARRLLALKNAAVRAQLDALTPAVLRRWRERLPAGEAEPVALLAGHPRSGTTLLESIVDTHPGLVSVEETPVLVGQLERAAHAQGRSADLHAVAALDALPPAVVRAARSGYLAALRQYPDRPADGRVLLDKNPALTNVIGSVLRFFPEMRLLIALREPRDVCLSCFRQSVGVAVGNVAWLRMEDTVAYYREMMGAWVRLRAMLPEDAWREVRYEALVADTEAVARDTLRFLGLPWTDEVLAFHEPGRRRAIFSPTYVQAAQPVYRSAVNRWERYASLVEPHAEALAGVSRALGYA